MREDLDISDISLETISLLQQTSRYKILPLASFDHAIEMHSLYDLPLPSSYNKVSAWVVDFFAFSYASPPPSLYFFSRFESTGHERVNRLSYSQRWLCRCRDWSKLRRMHRSSKKFAQQAALLRPCGVIFLYYRVQLPVDGYVRLLSSGITPSDSLKMEVSLRGLLSNNWCTL